MSIGTRNTLCAIALVIAVIWAISAAQAEGARNHLGPAKLRSAFECIHKHEGAWNSNTGNGYYGGLQVDVDFQEAYGREYLEMWGRAHRWPPYIQIAVAMRAYKVRGFGPWPNTRRMCGV